MKKKLAAALCVGMVCMTMTLLGCASQEDSADEAAVTQQAEIKVIGTEENAAYKVTLKNATEKEITGVSIKHTDDAAYPENMLADGDVFEVDESRILCYTKPEAEEEYDVQLTFADATTAELHAFPFADIEDGEILYADDVAYISYISLKTNEKMETKEAELAMREQQIRAAEEAAAAAAAQKAAEEAAAQKAAPKAANSAPTKPVQQAPQESTVTNQEVSTGAGNTDGCIDDGLVY